MHEPVLFGRYRLLEPAGSGGSAQVWRAIDTATGDTVAVKRLHPIVFADPNARTRLERESRALEALEHPNVVAYRELHVEDDEAALVLDYVDGVALDERLAAGPPIAVGETVSIVRDVAAALTAAHAVGIVHRDVKPGNVILATDGRALLTDFGIAADDADGATAALTATGTIVGTFRYMAPEQLRGTPASPVTDQYALAAVAYELLTGRPPYETTTPVGLAEAQTSPPSPLPGVLPGLEAAVLRGLSQDPAERYPDVAAFAAAVESAVRPTSAGTDTDVARAVSPVVAAAPAVAPTGPSAGFAAAGPGDRSQVAPPPRVRVAPRRARAAPRWAPVAAIGAILLGGALVVAAMSGVPDGGDPADPSAAGATLAPSLVAEPESAAPEPTAVPAAGNDGDGGGGNGDGDGGKGKGNDDKPDKPDKPDKGNGGNGKGKGNGGD
jgi:serine/threonine-protein kinase